MARLLVTGGAGFVGGNFVHHWRARRPDCEITVLDALTLTGNAERIADVPGVSLVVGDVRDTALVETLLRGRQIDTLVNFVPEGGEEGPSETDAVSVRNLLAVARTVWLDEGGGPRRFHHVSGSETAEGAQIGDPDGGLRATVSRCPANYGPYQLPESTIPQFLANALSNRRLPVNGDGSGRREWLHVEDHCGGIELVLERGRAGQAYDLGGGADVSELALVDALCGAIDAAFAADPELARRYPFAPPARGEQTSVLRYFVEAGATHGWRAMDWTKARDELGYAPARSFAEGLAETVQWYLANEEWWLPLLERNK